MPDRTNSDNAVFGADHQRCPVTGRAFEQGLGSLSHADQTANFVEDAERARAMPKPGEICSQTGRPFECGSGAHPKTAQTRQFLSEQSPAEKARRAAASEALNAMAPAGKA